MILHELTTRHSSRSDEFVLYPLGDIHLGARACDTEALRDTIDEIKKTDRALWVGMGDYAECISLSDKRFDPKSIDPRFLPRLDDLANACFEELHKLLEPIKDKCVCLLTGNHEETARLRYSQDVHGALCLRLGVKNLGYDSMIRWQFRRGKGGPVATIIVFASHGTIAGRKQGGKLNRMMDVATNFDADLYLWGHGHTQVAGRRVEIGLAPGGKLHLQERLKLGLMTGTYRRTYQEGTLDYSEKFAHDPSPIGTPRVVIRPWAVPRRRFEVRMG